MVELVVFEIIKWVGHLFIITLMLGFGLTLTLKHVSKPVRAVRFLAKTLILNFLIIPLIAYGVALLFNILTGLAVGFILMVIAPGSPIAPKIARFAKSDVPLTTSLMLIFILVSVVTIPVSLMLMYPGSPYVFPFTIAINLILFQLLPLIIGIIILRQSAPLAQKLAPIMSYISYGCIGILSVLILVLFGPVVISVAGELLAILSLIMIGVSLVLGYLFGGRRRELREVLTYSTPQRNLGAAILAATTSFILFPELVFVLVAILMYAFLQSFIVLVVSYFFRKRRERTTPAEVPTDS